MSNVRVKDAVRRSRDHSRSLWATGRWKHNRRKMLEYRKEQGITPEQLGVKVMSPEEYAAALALETGAEPDCSTVRGTGDRACSAGALKGPPARP